MSVQITKEDREVCIRIHDASWAGKIHDLDREMRQQNFWKHETTDCSLDGVLPDPDDNFADLITNDINYNDWNWDDDDLTFYMDADDYDEAKFRRTVESYNNWSARLGIEEIRIYEIEDEGEIYVGFINDCGDEIDCYRFDYETNEDEDEDEDEEVSQSSSENNFLDDIFSPAPDVVRVTESSGNEDRDRALQAAREAAQWFSDKLGISVNDEI